MKVYEIDFSQCKTYLQFFEEIIKGMQFPSWCGKNFSAIWDMLTWEIYTPCIICLKDTDSLPSELEQDKEHILDIFARASKWYKKLKRQVEIIIED